MGAGIDRIRQDVMQRVIHGRLPFDGPLATTPDILRTVRETVELLLEPLREQLTIANQRADRAERRIDELQAALNTKTQELNSLLTAQRAAPPVKR